MAATLEQRRKQRFQFLRALYEMSRGSERVLFYVEEVGDTVGLGVLEAENASQYLAEKRLIRVVMAHIISISQAGADELEAALEQPDQPTTHFPPAQSIPAKQTTPPPAIAAAAPSIQQAPIQLTPIQPPPDRIVENDSDELAAVELQRICAAIGLDPQEITGELAPHHNRPFPQPVHQPDPAPAHEKTAHEELVHEEPIARTASGREPVRRNRAKALP